MRAVLLRPGSPVAQLGRYAVGRPAAASIPARRVDHRDGDAEQRRDLGGDLLQPAAAQHDLDERPVGLLGAGEHRGLAVEDVGQHLVEDVVEADVVGQQDQREAQPVGLLDHLVGQPVQIAAELDRERREAALVQVGHEPAERLGVLRSG